MDLVNLQSDWTFMGGLVVQLLISKGKEKWEFVSTVQLEWNADI